MIKSLAQEGYAQGEKQDDMISTLNSFEDQVMALQFKKSTQVLQLWI
jgi:hypothetical protein